MTGHGRENPARRSRKLGVVVVNYGVADELRESLARFRPRPDIAVVVVDNYFSAAERETCRHLASEMGWSLVEMPMNAGFGAGCNAGVAWAKGHGCEDILLLNPDAAIELDDIAKLQARSSEDDRAMVAPLIMAPDPRSPGSDRVWFRGGMIAWTKGVAFHSLDPAPSDGFDWLTAACLYLRVEAWTELGGFDESYFLYWEDVDFTHRWKRSGGRLIVLDDATAYHRVGGTQTGPASGKSTTFIRYNLLNRARFASLHGDPGRRLVWALTTPLAVVRLLRRNRAAFLGAHASGYWKALAHGTFGGLRLILKDESHTVSSPDPKAGTDG